MGVFKVNVDQQISYFDAVYCGLFMNLTAAAEVSCPDREGSEDDVKYINNIIETAIMDQFSKYDREKVSYKDLESRNDETSKAVSELLAGRGITLNSFVISSITPDERSMKGIELRDKMLSHKSMTSEDYAKSLEEAQKAAQARLDSMTPEERMKAQEDVRKMAEAQMAQVQQAIEQAKAIQNAAAAGAAAGAIAAGQPLRKKFCTNCGAPAGLGKFCVSCGKPL